MKFTATQIAGILEGKVEGNPNAEVWNVAKIEEGAPGMISFLANPKYTHYIYETQSSIVIVNDDFEATAPIKATLIRVPDAYACFAKLLAFYDQMTQNKQGVSSLAFVSSTAQCGENLYLGEFAFVGENAKIGNNVKLYPQVYVGDGCVIGDNTVLYPGVKLYRNTIVGKNCILHAGYAATRRPLREDSSGRQRGRRGQCGNRGQHHHRPLHDGLDTCLQRCQVG